MFVVSTVSQAVQSYPKVKEVQFTAEPRIFNQLWDVRRGIIPAAGAMRPTSTSVILEGVPEIVRIAASFTSCRTTVFLFTFLCYRCSRRSASACVYDHGPQKYV